MRLAPFTVVVVLSGSLASPARAAPWFDAGQDALEDRLADGDLDQEDVATLRPDGAGRGAVGREARGGSSNARGESWFSVVGFERALMSGKNDVGAIVVVGLALDRVASGPAHRLADPPVPAPTKRERRLPRRRPWRPRWRASASPPHCTPRASAKTTTGSTR